MNRRNVFSIHLIRQKHFILRVQCVLDWDRHFVVLALEVSIICYSNELKIFADKITLLEPHDIKKNVSNGHSRVF